MPPMVKRVMKIVAWNLGLTLLFVLFAELAFGSWFKAPGLWNLGVFTDVRWQLDASAYYPRQDAITYSRDYYGLRGSFGKPEHANILVLGGSTTDDRVVDDGETWTEALGACLAGRGIAARVANAGVAGQSTKGHAANFDLWFSRIPGLKPSVVVAFFGVNEGLIDKQGDRDDVTRYHETVYDLSAWHNFRNWVGRNSAVLRLQKIIKGNIKAYRAKLHPASLPAASSGQTLAERSAEALAARKTASIALDSDELRHRKSEMKRSMETELAAFGKRLAHLKEKVEGMGARPLFVPQGGGGYRLEGGWIWGDVDQYLRLRILADATMDYCREAQIACIDLVAALQFVDGDVYDGAHTTAQGSAKIGQAVCRRFDSAWLPAR